VAKTTFATSSALTHLKLQAPISRLKRQIVQSPSSASLKAMYRYILSPNLYPKHIVRLWLRQDQLQRALIGFGYINHIILATFRLMGDSLMLPRSARPQVRMTVRIWWYECGLWIITSLLFRHLDRFFCFRRPSKAYKRSVYAIIYAAPVPLLVMYIWTIILAAGYDRKRGGSLSFAISLWTSVAAFILLLPIQGLYIRLARRFLLAENDTQYEPTRPIRYRDDPRPSISSSSSRGQSYLHDAWTDSMETRQPIQRIPAQASPALHARVAGSETTTDAATLPESNTIPMIASPADRCHATGYINAIPYTLRGHRAWLRHPLFYMPLAFYMTFLTWKMVAIIQAKNMEPQLKYE
jgi:hypothetical protein